MSHSKKNISGITTMLRSSVAFSLMALCVKLASETLPSLEIVFFRSFLGALMLLAIMRAKHISIFGTERRILTLRGLSGFGALILYFYTLGRLPLGLAVILNYTSPIFAAILAILFLKERPHISVIFLTLIAFLGVHLLVSQGHSFASVLNEERTWLIGLGLLSAIFAGIAYVTVRAIKHRESPMTIIFYFTGISTIGSLFFLPFGFKWPNAVEWLLLLGVAIFSFYGQLWLTIALRRAPASTVIPFSYLTPLLSFLWGFLLWNEALTFQNMIGVILIITAGCLISMVSRKKRAESNA